MKKIISIFVLVFFLFLVGCNETETKTESMNFTELEVIQANVDKESYSLTDVENLFIEKNITIEERIIPFYEFIEADNGSKYIIDNVTIEVYEYNSFNLSVRDKYVDSLSSNESYILLPLNLLVLIHSTQSDVISFYDILFS